MKILIVENDRILTKVWEKRLSKENEINVAYNVHEALNLLEHNYVPDLLFLDLRLNGPHDMHTNGLTIYSNVRKINKKTPIAIITGLDAATSLYQKAAKIVAVDDFAVILEKPISLSEIKSLINGTHEFKSIITK